MLTAVQVYHPCALVSKKRYVGLAWMDRDLNSSKYDAKGIETVRRDTCPAVAKIMEKSIRMLFTTKDLSKIKRYLQRQWSKIMSERVSVKDFIFAKEVRLGTYRLIVVVLFHGSYVLSNKVRPPPGVLVSTSAMAKDPRAEPRFGERVPYVVVAGPPGSLVSDLVTDPLSLLKDKYVSVVVSPLVSNEDSNKLRLHASYYITRQMIPALNRIFQLAQVGMYSLLTTLFSIPKLLGL